jgi:hypothetical protein
MKYLIKTTEDVKYTKEIAKEVSSMYKKLGFDISFDVKPITLDFEGDFKYKTEYMIPAWLIPQAFRFLKWEIVAMLKEEGYDGTCLFVADSKVDQSSIVRGIQTMFNNYSLIQVYSEPKQYIKKQKDKKGDWYNNNSKKKTDLKRDVFVLYHEVAHHLEKLVGMNGLHKAEIKNVQREYIETCIVLLKKNATQ